VTVWEYALGIAALAGMVVPVALACRTLCARWMPDWHGSQRLLAAAVMFVATLVLVAQVLGTVGLFRRWTVAVACTSVGLLVWQWARRTPPPAGHERPAPRGGFPQPTRRMVAISAMVVAVVVVRWVSATIIDFQYGMSDSDSLSYHGPFAARFVQTGWVTPLHYALGNAHFYPANGELVQAIAILPFHRDLLLPLVNLGWLAIALLAGWCAGRPFGAAPATVAGTALVLGAPLLISFNAGTAGNDIATLALTLAVVALLLQTGWRPAELAVAGAAAGLAMGTKLNVVPPLALLVVALPLVLRGSKRGSAAVRRASMLAWTSTAVGFSALWYVRNAVTAGNPLPWLRLGIGPLALPRLAHPDTGQELGVPLYRYGIDPDRWPELRAGLVFGLGRAWPLLLLLSLGGMVAAIVTGPGALRRLLGGFGFFAALAYLANPLSAGGIDALGGGFFRVNIRYLSPAIVTGMVLLPLVPALSRARAQAALLGTCTIGAIITTTGYPSTDAGNHVPPVGPLAMATAVGVALLGTVLVRSPPVSSAQGHRLWLWSAVAVGSAVVVGGGWGAQRQVAKSRYRDGPPSATTAAHLWAQPVSHQRIAVAGTAAYPLYGADLSNRVETPVVRFGRGDIAPIASCTSWRRALAEGNYGYVVLLANPFGPPEETLRWTRTIPRVREIVSDGRSWVFRLPSDVTAVGCL